MQIRIRKSKRGRLLCWRCWIYSQFFLSSFSFVFCFVSFPKLAAKNRWPCENNMATHDFRWSHRGKKRFIASNQSKGKCHQFIQNLSLRFCSRLSFFLLLFISCHKRRQRNRQVDTSMRKITKFGFSVYVSAFSVWIRLTLIRSRHWTHISHNMHTSRIGERDPFRLKIRIFSIEWIGSCDRRMGVEKSDWKKNKAQMHSLVERYSREE